MPRATIYHNVAHTRHGPTLAPAIFARHPSGYEPSDTVAIAFAFVDERPGADPLAVCERAFELGNIDREMTDDLELRALVDSYRSERIRSVSVGDVVTVDGIAYAVATFGFDEIGPGAGLRFAAGRHAREVRELVDTFEREPGKLTDADRSFVEQLIV